MNFRFVVPALLIATTLAILISLGFWQLDRANQKRIIETKILTANSGGIELVNKLDLLDNKEYYHVQFEGRYLGNRQFIYDNQIVEKVSGYYVLTPFVLEEGSKAILINRGFIAWNGARDKLVNIDIENNKIKIKVQVSKPVKRIELKSGELGEDFPVLIQAIDLKKMGAIAEIDFANMIGLLDPIADHGFVRKWEPYTGSIAKHIGYAIQWFLMALVLCIIGVRLALKHRKNNYI